MRCCREEARFTMDGGGPEGGFDSEFGLAFVTGFKANSGESCAPDGAGVTSDIESGVRYGKSGICSAVIGFCGSE